MPDKHEQAEQMRGKVPSTIARSDDKAVRTYKKTLESAEETYGHGRRAHQAAYASLKHTHEKVGTTGHPRNTAVRPIRRQPRAPRSPSSDPGRPHRAST